MSLRRSFLPLLLLTLSVDVAWAAPVGTPQDFAALTVRPSGPEELDLTTGVTTLPQGGEISYREEGVTLVGSFIRYLEGDFIEVETAVVRGEFGMLEAPSLRFEFASQRLRAARGATFVGEALKLGANTTEIDLKGDVAVLSGGVTSTDPELSGEGALVDLTGQQALLVGPYRYQDGPFVLRGDKGALLALRWDAAGVLSAETVVPAALQARFAPYLP